MSVLWQLRKFLDKTIDIVPATKLMLTMFSQRRVMVKKI